MQDGQIGNSVKHAIWAALDTLSFESADTARFLNNLHEIDEQKKNEILRKIQTKNDSLNNETGILIALQAINKGMDPSGQETQRKVIIRILNLAVAPPAKSSSGPVLTITNRPNDLATTIVRWQR